MPQEVQDSIYNNFLFDDLMFKYQNSFYFVKIQVTRQASFYTRKNAVYRHFMISILHSLEPRLELQGTTLLESGGEVQEIYFMI